MPGNRSNLKGVRPIRDHWYPEIFERGTFTDWTVRGGQELGERAAAQVEKLLGEHQPESLEEAICRKLSEIVREAEK